MKQLLGKAVDSLVNGYKITEGTLAGVADVASKFVKSTADLVSKNVDITVHKIPPFKRYSRDTIKFFRTAKCPNCDFPIGSDLVDNKNLTIYDDVGREVVWTAFNRNVHIFKCANCGSPWFYLKPSDKIELRETDRAEEYIGEEQFIIDNSDSDVTSTRDKEFEKEWTKSFSIEYENAFSEKGEKSIKINQTGAKVSVEKSIKEKYSASNTVKETHVEKSSWDVPGRTKVLVTIKWKKIWQNGYVEMLKNEEKIKIPFRTAVGITYDQVQRSIK